jgi:hypothetical protein
MRTRAVAVGIALGAFVAFLPAYGHSFNLSQLLGGRQEFSTFKLIHIGDLKALMSKHVKLHVYDANSDATRAKFGVIPGATLLPSYDKYPLSMLPANKRAKLVFYCTDSH